MASMVDTVEDSFVEGTVPYAYDRFKKAMESKGIDLDSFAQSIEFDDVDNDVLPSYLEMCNTFNNETGLFLALEYHEQEDKYDEVDGHYWSVDGVWERTNAGEKYIGQIARKSFVTLG